MPVFVPSPAPGLGYGGAEYGYSPYGAPGYPRPPWTADAGYGGYAYGYHSYGSLDIEPPRVSAASSIDGYRIEVFFTEAMAIDTALLLAATYTLTPSIGAPATAISVEVGVEEGAGATSVILTHTGTTLGGTYLVTVAATVSDLPGNLILPTARTASLLTLGAALTFTAAPLDGQTIRLTFSENLLTEQQFSPGVEDPDAYGFETEYPVPITVESVAHPVGSDADVVDLTVLGMTSATYGLTVSPATAITYDGSYLPSAATTFTGSTVGTGTSTAGVSGLLLSKAAGVLYGWDFTDTSGKILPNSTYRIDLVVDASAAVYAPVLADAVVGTLTVSDGVRQVTLTLERVAGTDVLTVASGAFSVQVPVAWSAAETTLTLLRNQKGDHYAVLADGVPLVSTNTANLTGVATISSGARFSLGPAYAVTQFPVRSLTFTSSQTVFSGSWNFLHGVAYTFVGSGATTRPSILTARGPLVKDWGDETPATPRDVEVRVNGVAVEVASVNPYIGSITPAIPIPLTPPGTTTVEVDYTWFPNPIMGMAGLNTLGLVLNKWNHPQGHHTPTTSPLPANQVGAPDTARFPLSVVLNPGIRPRPVQIGWRYIGFERAYSALLNSPTTLLLNQNPNRISRGDITAAPEPITVSYGGDVTPPAASDPWILEGSDTGHVGTGTDLGYYVLVDASADVYPTGKSAFYHRSESLAFPSSVNESVRVRVRDFTPDGVFTGIGFGFHNDRYLYLVGLLYINDVHHVGVLQDPTRPYALDAWLVGPSFRIHITSATTFTAPASVFTTVGLRTRSFVFQILSGGQAGVYRTIACGIEVAGDTATGTLDPSTPFPSDPDTWGNSDADAVLEVPWDSDTTLRLVSEVEDATAQVFVGGTLSGLSIDVTDLPAYPAQTTLLLPTDMEGEFFWGSLSRVATSESLWALVNYAVTPDETTFHFDGIVVAAEMGTTPDHDANHPWFVTEDFGSGILDSGGLLLTSTAADDTLDTTFGYARIEPFLVPKTLLDLDAEFRVEWGVLGAGDAEIVASNTDRLVRFATILYEEGASRRLLNLAQVSITAVRTPSLDGWIDPGTLICTPRENILVTEQSTTSTGVFTKTLAAAGFGRQAVVRMRVAGSGLTSTSGPVVSLHGANNRKVSLGFRSSTPALVLYGTSTVATISFDWDDDAFHEYRLETDATDVVLTADGVVLGTYPITAFAVDSTDTDVVAFGAVGSATATVEWQALYVADTAPAGAKRTLGVLRRGGDPDDIDGWELPRTDALDVPNSDTAAVIEEMDWRADLKVRVRLDPGWGCTVFRPDLPPPPYYDGDFTTETTEPSAGWINVEYARLPRAPTGLFGRVSFGALDSRSVTQQRWSTVRYRIYTQASEDFIAPMGMVLNRYNVITSGELNRDVTPEVVEVDSITSTLVSLMPAHIYADRVFSVVVDTVVLGPSDWTFDRDTQTLSLVTPLTAEHVPVRVTFAPGKPVTNTYLCSQPLRDSVTLLNEGTPPVPMSQTGHAIEEVAFGSRINDPTDVLGDPDFVLNDPYRSVSFEDTPGTFYEDLDFCQVDDGNRINLLSIMCDGPAPEHGLIELALEGTAFSDGFSAEGGPAVWGAPGVPMRDSVGNFQQNNVFTLSGGSRRTGGTLGASILYPSYPAIPGPDRGAVIRAWTMALYIDSVFTAPGVEQTLTDDLSIATTASDNIPPSLPGAVDPDPDGTPGATGNGACIVETTDYGSTSYSRLGPWAGATALAVRSALYGGGTPASGTGFTLVGGISTGPIPTPVITVVEAAN